MLWEWDWLEGSSEVLLFDSSGKSEIRVFGNGVEIENGSNNPSLGNHTNFGSTPVLTPKARTFEAMSLGTANLIIYSILVPDDFTLTSPLEFPIVIESGDTSNFTIEANADVAGSFSGTVVIESNYFDGNFEFDIAVNVTN